MNFLKLINKNQILIAQICLILFVFLYFLYLQTLIPNFFLYDDNATAFLPFYTYNWNSVINNFTIPFINLHQYLGHTYLSQGQTGVFYPPVYICVFISKFLTGNHFLAIDILVLMHFSCSVVGMFFLLKRFDINTKLSFIFSLIWITFPFFTIIAKSWVFISYVAAFSPLNLILLDKLIQTPKFKHAIMLGALQSIFLYQGYVQYVFLLLLFEFFYLLLSLVSLKKLNMACIRTFLRGILINSDLQSINIAKSYILSKISFLCLSAPLLIPMFYQQQKSFRSIQLPSRDFINHSLDISVFLKTQINIFTEKVVFGASSEVFFIGIVSLILLSLVAKKINRSNKKIVILSILSFISLIFSTKLYYLFYEIPFFNLFRWPFKYFFFFLFFSTLAAALVSSNLLKTNTGFTKMIIYIGLILTVVFNCCLVIKNPRNAISQLKLEKTKLEYINSYIDKDRGRIFTFGLQNTKTSDLYKYFTFNFATLYNKFHFSGYDPLRSELNAKLTFGLNHISSYNGPIHSKLLDYLSYWSVRYLITADNKSFDSLKQYKQLSMIYRGNNTRLYENIHAFPLVHYYDENIDVFRKVLPEKIDFEFKVNEIVIHPRNNESRKVVVNIAPLEFFNINIDGIDKGFVKKTDIPLILEILPNTKKVSIKYIDYYFYSGLIISILFGLILLFIIIKNKYASST